MRPWLWRGYRDRQRTLALVMPLASRFARDRANLAFPRRFWRKRPKGLPLWRIARTDQFSTRHTLSVPRHIPISACSPRQDWSVQNWSPGAPGSGKKAGAGIPRPLNAERSPAKFSASQGRHKAFSSEPASPDSRRPQMRAGRQEKFPVPDCPPYFSPSPALQAGSKTPAFTPGRG
jgi:hypothetical protein